MQCKSAKKNQQTNNYIFRVSLGFPGKAALKDVNATVVASCTGSEVS